MLGEGKDLADIVRHLEVTESTYHRWRNQFGWMKAGRRQATPRAGAGEHPPQSLVADKELEIDALREISRGNW